MHRSPLRTLLTTLVLVLAVPSAAALAEQAPSAQDDGPLCHGEGWQERRGREALASLPAPRPTGFRVSFLPARPGYYGMARARTRTIEVYVRGCDAMPRALLRHVVAHELGHAHASARLGPARRAAWLRARGVPATTPWSGCAECADFGVPAGDYAEAYAQWLTGDGANHSTLAPPPSPGDLPGLARRFFTR